MQPQESKPDDQTTNPAALVQTEVTYIDGFWRTAEANRHSAVLEWGADSRIRLRVKDYHGEVLATVLDCSPQDIKSFSTGAGIGTIKLKDGKSYTVEFSSQALVASNAAAGSYLLGPIGMAVGTAIDKNAISIDEASGIEWWTQSLSKYGVGGLQFTARKRYKNDIIGWRSIGAMLGIAFLVLFVVALLFMFES